MKRVEPAASRAALTLVALTALAAPLSVAANTSPEQRQTAYLAANCANCHGTQGTPIGAMPPLAGLKRDYIAEQLRLFRDGKRPATIMHQLSKGYTDAQIDALADHFARLPAAR